MTATALAWDYAPALESATIADVQDRYLPFIDGAFVEGHGEDAESEQDADDGGDREQHAHQHFVASFHLVGKGEGRRIRPG